MPRRGEYCLLDKEAGNHVSATVFQLPGKYGKGILVSPTIHGNLLVGPTAVDQEDKDGTYTTAEGLAEACEKAAKSVNNIPFRQGMGRCQAGFCTPRAMEILSREMGIPITEICKNRKGSEMIKGEEA